MWARPVIRPAADPALAVLDVPAIGQETEAHPRSAFEIGHEPVVVIRKNPEGQRNLLRGSMGGGALAVECRDSGKKLDPPQPHL